MHRFAPVLVATGISLCLLTCLGCGTGEETAVAASIAGGGEEIVDARGKKTRFDNVHPQIVIHTTAGDITAELDGEKSPLTVANFLAYLERKHYDGSIFHHVEPGVLILGGGFDARLEELSQDAPIRNEAHNRLKNVRGAIAMGRDGEIDSSTCRFFINLGDNVDLDHTARTYDEYGYCVFGKVTAGIEFADKIGEVPTKAVRGFSKLPNPPVEITSIERIR